MILAVFIVVAMLGVGGGNVSLQVSGMSADGTCNFLEQSTGGLNVVVPIGATKAQIQNAVKTALETGSCAMTFGPGDSTKLIP